MEDLYVEPVHETEEAAAEPVASVFESSREEFGRVIGMFQSLAHNPEMLGAVHDLLSTLETTELKDTHRELAYVMASHVNECDP